MSDHDKNNNVARIVDLIRSETKRRLQTVAKNAAFPLNVVEIQGIRDCCDITKIKAYQNIFLNDKFGTVNRIFFISQMIGRIKCSKYMHTVAMTIFDRWA